MNSALVLPLDCSMFIPPYYLTATQGNALYAPAVGTSSTLFLLPCSLPGTLELYPDVGYSKIEPSFCACDDQSLETGLDSHSRCAQDPDPTETPASRLKVGIYQEEAKALLRQLSACPAGDVPVVLPNRKVYARPIDPRKPNRGSSFIGVSSNGCKWQSLIVIRGRKRYLGLFFSAVTAARQFDKYSLLAHGLKVSVLSLSVRLGQNELCLLEGRGCPSLND